MTRARSLSLLANANAFTVSGSNNVGIGSTLPDGKLDVDGDILVGTAITIGKVSGIISATSYRGDGSQLTGVDSSNLIDSGDTNRVAANTSGIVVTGIATVTGNMNVGGVLTYDDVTNVDSLGIITARSHVSIADSILHTGDTDTAIRFPSAGTFTIETNGSERFEVTDSLKEVKNGNLRITSTFIEFSGDVSTPSAAAALYRPADNEFAISTGNNERLRINSSGNVGIGTTLPAYNLEVFGNNALISGSSAANLILEDRGVADASNPFFLLSTDGGVFTITTADRNASGTTTNSTERLRIDSSGNMGLSATPEDWEAGQFFAFQFGKGGAVFGRAAGDEDRNGFVSNCYHDSAGWKYIASSQHATRYDQNDGNHIWNTAGTGTADAAVSFSESARIDTDGRLLVGRSATRTNWNDSSIEPKVFIEGAGDNDSAALCVVSNSGSTSGASRGALLTLARTKGTAVGSNTAVDVNTALGIIEFKGNDGTSFTTAAKILAQVDGTPGTDDMPGRLIFSTTADGAAVPTERLRIDSTGDVLPGADNSQDLGSTSKRWANIYSADLQLSNEGSSNDVDGTWGQYTIQEGENDLFLLNRRNGKKYKFVLQEVN